MYEPSRMQHMRAMAMLPIAMLICIVFNAAAESSSDRPRLLVDIPGVGWTGGSRPSDWGEILRRDKVTVYIQHDGPGWDGWTPPKEPDAYVIRLPQAFDTITADRRIKPLIDKAFTEGKDVHLVVDMNLSIGAHLTVGKLSENKWAGKIGDYVTGITPGHVEKLLATHSRGTVTCAYLDMSKFAMAIVASPRGDLALDWINSKQDSTKVRIVTGESDWEAWRWKTFIGTGLGHLSRCYNVEIWRYEEVGGRTETHSELAAPATAGRWTIIASGNSAAVYGSQLDLFMRDLAQGGMETGGVSMGMSVSGASFRPMDESTFPVPSGTERVFVSLTKLEQNVQECIVARKKISTECLSLSRVGYFEGYIVERNDPKDIILFGLASKNRPNLNLDDLIVNMRAIANAPDYPYCSLDPSKENTIALQKLFASAGEMNSLMQMKALFRKVQEAVGPQEVVIGGVPRNSRHAHAMIDADYHMKKVSQGQVSVNGVTSYLDHSLNEAADKIRKGESVPATGMSMARFWFHIGEGSPKFQQGTDIVAIDECSMIILTEKQKATASGELVDVVEDDPHAMAFASEMSEYLSIPSSSTVPIYAELENLFRLRALLLSMEHQGAFESIGWSFATYLSEYKYKDEKPMEPSMPGLANFKEWSHEVSSGSMVYSYTLFPMVCGGVGMDMSVGNNDYRDDLASSLFSFRTAALMARPSRDALFWKVAE